MLLALALVLTLAYGQHEEEAQTLEPYKLYSNFDISHLIRPGMSWYELLDIRQQLRRPTLSFYVDKRQYKARMTELGIDIPQIYHVQNADPAADEATFESITQSLENLLAVQKDYVAKPTHLSCSDQVYVVKNGLNIYSKLHAPVQPRLVAANMTMALRTRSSVWGESWALHHVPPGILIEERISAGGDDDTAALEFKTIVIWGRVWASEVKRGTDTLQILGRDGRGLQGEGQHPDLAQVEWARVRSLAERLAVHTDCFRVDIFVAEALASRRSGLTALDETRAEEEEEEEEEEEKEEQQHQHHQHHQQQPERARISRYLVSEVEIFMTQSLPLFKQAAALWLEGYSRRIELIPNGDIRGPYASMQDPEREQERSHFATLRDREAEGLGWANTLGSARTYGSLEPSFKHL
jgi:hypothetical protein